MNSEPIFISLGSNVGDREHYLRTATALIQEMPGTAVIERSLIYQTAPVGFLAQPNFLNQVLCLETEFDPYAFLKKIQKIEFRLGRQRNIHWGPRTIDIDILLWGRRIIASPVLTVPHSEMANRRFVLEPLAEIAADFPVPPGSKTVCVLLEELPRDESVDVYDFQTPILF